MCNCTSCCSRGPQGPIGFGWQSGNGVPVAAPTNNQIFYVDLDNNDVYEYIGATWTLIGNLGVGVTNSFNLLLPSATDGVVNPGHAALAGDAALGTSDDVSVWLDRNNCSEDVVISFTSPPDPSFVMNEIGGVPGATVTIPGTESTPGINNVIEISWTPGILAVGTYTFTLTFTTATCGTRTQDIELVLT